MDTEVLRAIGVALAGGLGGALLTVFAYGRRQMRVEWNDNDLARRLDSLKADVDAQARDINGIGGKVTAVATELRAETSSNRVKFAVLAEKAGVRFGADRSFPPESR